MYTYIYNYNIYIYMLMNWATKIIQHLYEMRCKHSSGKMTSPKWGASQIFWCGLGILVLGAQKTSQGLVSRFNVEDRDEASDCHHWVEKHPCRNIPMYGFMMAHATVGLHNRYCAKNVNIMNHIEIVSKQPENSEMFKRLQSNKRYEQLYSRC